MREIRTSSRPYKQKPRVMKTLSMYFCHSCDPSFLDEIYVQKCHCRWSFFVFWIFLITFTFVRIWNLAFLSSAIFHSSLHQSHISRLVRKVCPLFMRLSYLLSVHSPSKLIESGSSIRSNREKKVEFINLRMAEAISWLFANETKYFAWCLFRRSH